MTTPRPAYRYLEPLPDRSVLTRTVSVVRWAVLLAAVLWFLILMSGFLIARAVT